TLKEAGGFYDRFRGRLMFPICDTQSRVVAFGGRIIGEGEPKYLNSPETAVYTKGQHLFGMSHSRDSIRQRDYGILVEGYLDFLIPFQEGVRNLVASLGTALTENQVRLLGRYTRKIVVNFDPDSAGVSATKRSLEMLLGEGFKVNVLTLPDNLDPDEFVRARGADGYLKLLKHSQAFLDYIVEQAVAANDQTRPAGKVETINAILPYLKLVKDRIERAEQFERIADRVKIDSKLIRDEFRKAVETRQEKVSARAVMASVALKPAERKLLEILLSCQPVRRQMSYQMTEEDYFGLRTEKLFHLIFEFERQQEEMTYPNLSRRLDDEELSRDLLPQLMMSGTDFESTDQDTLTKAEREAEESLHSLRCGKLAEKQSALQAEMNHAQRENNTARLGELMMLKFELAKQEKELARRTGK
ncbi:MAG TPA: toprim domain-containing protein, partial [Blastocatellia bacterium]|nr:toprim domain-containing protein [Blastocatellia bacterium]